MITIRNKYEYDCEVLIVGGGPAGSGLAFHLAKVGVSVIVVESATFPRDKVCGDGVSPIALAELHAMGITKTESFKKANEIKRVGLFLNEEQVVVDLSKPDHLPLHARIIPRLELDSWIYEAARAAGARFLQATRFCKYEIKPGVVTTWVKQKEGIRAITSKLMVGADGSNSAVARQMHGAKSHEHFQLLGLRAYFENVNGPQDRVDIYFAEESFPGIYWMFPKGRSGANIGMAMVSATLPQSPKHVRELLQQHLENNKHIQERIGKGRLNGKILGWPIHFFNASLPVSGHRILLTGDAAGLINPLSGDGIQYALLSARWAAHTIVDALKGDDLSAEALLTYRKKMDQELAYDFAFSNFLVQFSRNKSLSKVWMQIIRILIERAKTDREYADTIAGIFEGTYPSFKALTPAFIQKSLWQGGATGLQAVIEMAANPMGAVDKGRSLFQAALSVLGQVKAHPAEQRQWVADVIKNGVAVADHTLKHIVRAAADIKKGA
ncbi:NAD(P)/FAD-dependent oxidoreductase [Niabella insulamsoli]|uniref:NAD(P)/FAD-dependent oxidoreductase n=1 Tax=Niabella insulamsoli TaxID=3144874 RepID=UPI0031FCA075